MRIPFNNTVAPIAAPQIRRVNDKSVQANAIQEQAQQGLAAGVNAAVQTGNQIYQSHIEKQYATDMVAGSAMMDQFKFERDSEIKAIPVDSAVDYAAEVKKIDERANARWRGYSKANIRNQDHPTVRQARQQSIDAFAIDGATTSARLGVQYEDARNVNNIELAEGIKAGQLKADPYNAQTVAELQQFQDARLALGVITQAEAEGNKASIQTKAYQMADGQTMLRAEQLAYGGDYESAGDVIDNELSPEYSKAERTDEKNKILGAGSYNRLNDMASATRTVSGWAAYSDELKADTYMDAGNKKILKTRERKGINGIETSQKANLKRMFSDSSSARGFDSTEYDIGAANDSKGGLSMVASPRVKNAMIENAALFTSAVEVKDDKRAFTQAAKDTDRGGIKSVGTQFDDILEAQLTGSMSEAGLIESLKDSKARVKDGEWSAKVGRQMEREAMKAYESSLEDDTAIRGIDYKWINEDIPMPEQVVSVYKTVNDSLRRQNELLGSFVDASGRLESIRTDLTEWIEQNPSPDPTAIQEKAKKLSDIIKEDTRRAIRLRNQ